MSVAAVFAAAAVPALGQAVKGDAASPNPASPAVEFKPDLSTTPVTHPRTVNVAGFDIVYRKAGPKDAPAVLLVHGFPTSSQMFRNLIPSLADKYHLVAPDYPGSGYSSMPPRDQFAYTFDNLAMVMDAFTEKLGLPKYAIYVQDYGAPIGYRLASKHPSGSPQLLCRTETHPTKASTTNF